MPTASGKLQLSDYDLALVNEGFDGFQQVDRYQMINFGYRYVARKFPWTWRQTSQTYVVNPGSASIAIQGGGAPGSADIIRSVDIVTDPYRKDLEPMTDDDFTEHWLYADLTLAANRSIPTSYALWEDQLYILPPPQVAVTIAVAFSNFLPDMVNATDVPVTPQQYDEVILDAARVRAHRRAKEMELSMEAQERVNEALDDMLMNEAMQNWDVQDRVRPDDQWL